MSGLSSSSSSSSSSSLSASTASASKESRVITYHFQGQTYLSYNDAVVAKRKSAEDAMKNVKVARDAIATTKQLKGKKTNKPTKQKAAATTEKSQPVTKKNRKPKDVSSKKNSNVSDEGN